MLNQRNKTMKFDIEPELTPAEFIDVLRRSTLAERRPVGDVARIARMLAEADLVVSARESGDHNHARRTGRPGQWLPRITANPNSL